MTTNNIAPGTRVLTTYDGTGTVESVQDGRAVVKLDRLGTIYSPADRPERDTYKVQNLGAVVSGPRA